MKLAQLLEMSVVQRLAAANYTANGMPIGIVDGDGSVLVGCGWQDICARFHRVHPRSLERCKKSDSSIKTRISQSQSQSEKPASEHMCENGLRDIGIPIVVAGEHLATLFLGQFFYEGESVNREFFVEQAREFGYDEPAYLAALDRVPVFSPRLVASIIEYDKALARFVADLAEGALQHIKDQQALKESEERYRSLFESSADAIVAVDLDGRYTEANPAALKMLGYTREELSKLTYQQLTPARWLALESAILREQVPARGYSDEYEKEYIRRDGALIPVGIRAFLKADFAGRAVGNWGIIRDLTERKRAEAALTRSEARFRALIEKSTDVIFVVDVDGRITFWSPSATEVLGWTAEEVLGRSRFDFVHPDDHPILANAIAGILPRAGAAARITTRNLHKNGSWLLIESEGRNLLSDPAVQGIVVNSRDVTEQRRMEEQFHQACASGKTA